MKNFKTLWSNFPEKKVVSARCFNKQKDSSQPFSDYCAILLSECFIKSGINISTYKGKCWSHVGQKHILLAENLAEGLRVSPPSHFGTLIKVDPKKFQDKLSKKTGVIFFKDYWQRGKEEFDSRSGDHIDLWNKNEITASGMTMRSIYEFFGAVSDLNKSKEVWFWEVK
jgi:hypothetical protein